MMGRFWMGLVLSGLWLGCATPQTAPPQVATKPEPQAFLWEARKGETVLFLVGSIHLGRKDGLPLSPSMEQALAASDALVVEVDATAADPAVMQRMVMERGVLPPDQPGLRDQLSPEDAERFEALLTRSGAPLQQFDRLRPWMAAISVVMLELAAAGFEADSGVDLQFLRRAKGAREIIELETLEQQLSLFSDLPHPEQLLMLQEALRSGDQDAAEMLGRMVEAWTAGDAATIEQEVLGEMKKPEYAALYRKVFTDRNHAMARKLKHLIQADPGKKHLVVVGAGHVVGEEGLLALLKQDGFELRQVARGAL